jgi:peroxiredoxin
MAVEAGQQAPDFDLQVNADTRVRLADFRGEKNVLLVFHPFAFTGICEAEACDLQDNLGRYRDTDTEVVFVSCDPWPARQAWKKELGHDYTFASDFWPHGAAAQAYGIFNEERGISVRATFLIGKDGVVRWTVVNQPGDRRETLVEDSLAAIG